MTPTPKRVLLALVALAGCWCLPLRDAALRQYPAGRVVEDAEGGVLRRLPGPGGVDCRPITRVDPRCWIARAVVAAEDKRFWRHPGVDPLAVMRAIRLNVRSGRVVSGASTLSTMVIRLAHPRRRTLAVKCVEAFQATRLEREQTKEQILTQFLNRAPFGGNTVGIEAASRRYFDKPCQDLSLAEAALLAGLPQSPGRLRPDRHPDRARQRQRYVLGRMLANGEITPVQWAAALRQPLRLRREVPPFRAPHFVELALRSGGDGGRTTLDPRLQAVAEQALTARLAAVGGGRIGGGAVVVLRVRDGAVLALVGSPDYFAGERAGQVNGALARRSPGSTLKPFLYALAFDQGRITPASVLSDGALAYRDFVPANFDERLHGAVDVRQALIQSLNLPALRLMAEVGPAAYLEKLRAVGLRTLERDAAHYGMSLVLGGGEVRLLDLTAAYGCLARGGTLRPPRCWPVAAGDAAAPAPQLYSPEACWLVSDILAGSERGLALRGHAAGTLAPRVSWKTGTSAGLRDAWTIAWNGETVVGVWLGNPDGRADPALVGVEAAAPLAGTVIDAAASGGVPAGLPPPPGLRAGRACARSGDVPGARCACQVADWRIDGVTRFRRCGCSGEAPVASVVQAAAADAALRLQSPLEGGIYRLAEHAAGGRQAIPLRALASPEGGVYWFADGEFIGHASGDETRFWSAAAGTHTIICADAAGRATRVHLRVVD